MGFPPLSIPAAAVVPGSLGQGQGHGIMSHTETDRNTIRLIGVRPGSDAIRLTGINYQTHSTAHTMSIG